jgi:hypothetical protein
MRTLLVCLLYASPVLALPDAPVPKIAAMPAGFVAAPKPLARQSWLSRPETLAAFQGLAALADGITTHQYISRGYVEVDPLTKPLIGLHPSYARMIPLGIAEVAGSYVLARKWPRLRWLQIGLTAAHAGCAGHNLTLH